MPRSNVATEEVDSGFWPGFDNLNRPDSFEFPCSEALFSANLHPTALDAPEEQPGRNSSWDIDFDNFRDDIGTICLENSRNIPRIRPVAQDDRTAFPSSDRLRRRDEIIPLRNCRPFWLDEEPQDPENRSPDTPYQLNRTRSENSNESRWQCCQTRDCASFATWNDLARHVKSVHGDRGECSHHPQPKPAKMNPDDDDSDDHFGFRRPAEIFLPGSEFQDIEEKHYQSSSRGNMGGCGVDFSGAKNGVFQRNLVDDNTIALWRRAIWRTCAQTSCVQDADRRFECDAWDASLLLLGK